MSGVMQRVSVMLCVVPLGCSGAGATSTATGGASGAAQHANAGTSGSTSLTAGAGGNSAGGAAQSGAGGVAGDASGLSGAGGQMTQAQPMCGPGCFAICQAGQCQCECSPLRGCDAMGWQAHTVSWANLAQPAMTGGVELCMPDTWAPLEPDGEQFSNGQITFSVFAEVRLDHADALQRLSDTDQAWCTATDYELTFTSAGTLPDQRWPALMQRYKEMPPACGACPNPAPATELNTVANVSIAFGEYVLQTHASAPESMGPLDEVIDIGRTAHVQTAQTPPQSGSEIGDLYTDHAAACPQQ